MSRIVFDDQRPSPTVNPGRFDVACFVGLVRLSADAAQKANSAVPTLNAALTAIASDATTGLSLKAILSAAAIDNALQANLGGLVSWFGQQGWSSGPFKPRIEATGPQRQPKDLLELLDVPVPIESFGHFTGLFDAGGSGQASGTDYLAAAVRSFFAQGGRRCYVIRMGDPISPSDDPAKLLAKLAVNDMYPAEDQRGWSGVTHLAGLPEVSFLLLPDLPILSASLPPSLSYAPSEAPAGPEQFVECSIADLTPSGLSTYSAPAPTLAATDYKNWASVVMGVVWYLSNSARGVQFVAAMPLPQSPDIATAAGAKAGSAALLAANIHDVLLAQFDEKLALPASLSTAFLQLGYPWLRTTGSFVLNEGLEPPDGALAGVLARNALTRGTFKSATKVTPSEVFDVWPTLPTEETQASDLPLSWGSNSRKPLIERLSLFGFTPAGMALLSDVTASAGESYRAASVNRLISVISRSAHRLGEELVFANSSENQWARLRNSLTHLMTALWQSNALDGATAKDAFTVKCDCGTMTQNDIDNGRIIAVVTFTAAATIELIRVTLAIEPAGAAAQGPGLVLAGVA